MNPTTERTRFESALARGFLPIRKIMEIFSEHAQSFKETVAKVDRDSNKMWTIVPERKCTKKKEGSVGRNINNDVLSVKIIQYYDFLFQTNSTKRQEKMNNSDLHNNGYYAVFKININI